MRFLLASVAVSGMTLAAALTATAQQPAGHLSAEQREIGRVETRIQKYDRALGVVTRLNRPLGAETECSGICFSPSSSQPVPPWRCAPADSCDLHCEVRPAVGGCR